MIVFWEVVGALAGISLLGYAFYYAYQRTIRIRKWQQWQKNKHEIIEIKRRERERELERIEKMSKPLSGSSRALNNLAWTVVIGCSIIVLTSAAIYMLAKKKRGRR